MLLKVAECEHPETNRTAIAPDFETLVIVCLTCGAFAHATPVNVLHRGAPARDGPASKAVRDALTMAVVL